MNSFVTASQRRTVTAYEINNIKYIIDDISEAIGSERDDYKATVLNVRHGVNIIKKAFHDHPEIEAGELDVVGAVYDIETGKVEWVEN